MVRTYYQSWPSLLRDSVIHYRLVGGGVGGVSPNSDCETMYYRNDLCWRLLFKLELGKGFYPINRQSGSSTACIHYREIRSTLPRQLCCARHRYLQLHFKRSLELEHQRALQITVMSS